MSYRDDHDAALARIDALERELAAARAAPTSEPPVDDLSAKIRLDQEVAETRAQLAAPPAPDVSNSCLGEFLELAVELVTRRY